MASTTWLDARGLVPPDNQDWFVEITVETDDPDTRLELNVYPEEWGFVLREGPRVSSIRVTTEVFVHGRDDHHLRSITPALESMPAFLAVLEDMVGVSFLRARASVHTKLVRASSIVRAWLMFAR
jgi:hypothetical protein